MSEAAAGELVIGHSAEGEVRLRATSMNRHTFWCGQSGSGKTYALGVLLERLLLTTRLPLIVFDPNADFVRLHETRAGADAASTTALTERDIRVLRPTSDDGALRVRFVDLPISSKAAMLRLDPLIDRAEYNSMLRLEQLFRTTDPAAAIGQLRASTDESQRALAQRIENLELGKWDLWALGKEAVTDVIDERPDAAVLDLGGFRYPEEPLVVALAVLEHLWARRERREPVLLVIDEAQNLASPDLESPLGRAVREQLIRIAAEGRKFGLWLLLSTQRPSKIHSGILSQCDNLTLMKMSSPADIAELAAIFGFAPDELLRESTHLNKGQAIIAGGFVETPTVVQVVERLTEEGGSDVRVPLR